MNIVLFDGLCNLCNYSVKYIIQHDKDKIIYFSAQQTDMGKEIIKKYHLFSAENSVIFLKDDIAYYGSDAFIEICKLLYGFPKIFIVLKIIPKQIRDYFYRIIANYRYQIFGKRTTCIVPSDNVKNRFL